MEWELMEKIYSIYLSMFLVAQLIYLSILDIKYQRISNIELLPLILLGIFSISLRLFFDKIQVDSFKILFLVFHFGMSFYLYLTGFFGEADLKLNLILFFIILPSANHGITSNFDGLQYYLYFFISLLLFYSFQVILNVIITHWFQYSMNSFLSIWERIFLYSFCQLRPPSLFLNSIPLILQLNSQNVNIQIIMSKNQYSLCWVKKRIPMVPFLTFSVGLAIFT